MKSIFQKADGERRESGIGTIKVYNNGIVGYQPSGQSHSEYAKAMRSLRDITPQNGDGLLTTYFGKK